MALLFTASTDLGGTQRTSRLIVPVLRWVVPDISPAAIDRAQFAVRKSGHAVGYSILAALIWRGVRRTPAGKQASFQRSATVAFALAVLFAASDEWHQTFTATRQGSLADVALDAGGAAAGLVILWLWSRRQR